MFRKVGEGERSMNRKDTLMDHTTRGGEPLHSFVDINVIVEQGVRQNGNTHFEPLKTRTKYVNTRSKTPSGSSWDYVKG